MVLISIVTGAFVNQHSHHQGGPHIVIFCDIIMMISDRRSPQNHSESLRITQNHSEFQVIMSKIIDTLYENIMNWTQQT